jgi:hypothetical protein
MQTHPSSRAEAKSIGAKYYFTGLPCKHGHVAIRQTSNGNCKECDLPRVRANVLAWRAKQDPAWLRAFDAKRARVTRANNPEAVKATRKRFRQRHPHIVAARIAAWRMANAEHIRAYETAYDAKRSGDPVRKAAKAFSARKQESAKRAKVQGVPGRFTKADIDRLLAEQGGRCIGYGCGIDIRSCYEIDHQTPLIRGGTNWPDNLALMCRSCNARKHHRTMLEWLAVLREEKQMPQIEVTIPFAVNLPDGRIEYLRAGTNDVPDDVAKHPFVQAHLVGVPKGRMPLVEAQDNEGNPILVEADEAGQGVIPHSLTYDPFAPPVRQEGPASWHRSPAAIEQARVQAEANAEAGGVATHQPDLIAAETARTAQTTVQDQAQRAGIARTPSRRTAQEQAQAQNQPPPSEPVV